MIYDTINTIKARKIKHNPDKHIPNKLESKLLRKLMSENSLTEKEIRSNIKYKRMIAQASKSNESEISKKIYDWYYNLIKKACRETKLAPQHPKTIEVLQNILDKHTVYGWRIPWYIYNPNLNAKSVVNIYAK